MVSPAFTLKQKAWLLQIRSVPFLVLFTSRARSAEAHAWAAGRGCSAGKPIQT